MSDFRAGRRGAAEPFTLALDGGHSAADALTALIHETAGGIGQITGALRQITTGILSAHGSEEYPQTNSNSKTCPK